MINGQARSSEFTDNVGNVALENAIVRFGEHVVRCVWLNFIAKVTASPSLGFLTNKCGLSVGSERAGPDANVGFPPGQDANKFGRIGGGGGGVVRPGVGRGFVGENVGVGVHHREMDNVECHVLHESTDHGTGTFGDVGGSGMSGALWAGGAVFFVCINHTLRCQSTAELSDDIFGIMAEVVVQGLDMFFG